MRRIHPKCLMVHQGLVTIRLGYIGHIITEYGPILTQMSLFQSMKQSVAFVIISCFDLD